MKCFWDLNTTRQYEFGPVPWDLIVHYGCHVGIDGDIINSFVAIMRAMDAAYLKWSAAEEKKRRDASIPHGSKSGKTKTR